MDGARLLSDDQSLPHLGGNPGRQSVEVHAPTQRRLYATPQSGLQTHRACLPGTLQSHLGSERRLSPGIGALRDSKSYTSPDGSDPGRLAMEQLSSDDRHRSSAGVAANADDSVRLWRRGSPGCGSLRAVRRRRQRPALSLGTTFAIRSSSGRKPSWRPCDSRSRQTAISRNCLKPDNALPPSHSPTMCAKAPNATTQLSPPIQAAVIRYGILATFSACTTPASARSSELRTPHTPRQKGRPDPVTVRCCIPASPPGCAGHPGTTGFG